MKGTHFKMKQNYFPATGQQAVMLVSSNARHVSFGPQCTQLNRPNNQAQDAHDENVNLCCDWTGSSAALTFYP